MPVHSCPQHATAVLATATQKLRPHARQVRRALQVMSIAHYEQAPNVAKIEFCGDNKNKALGATEATTTETGNYRQLHASLTRKS